MVIDEAHSANLFLKSFWIQQLLMAVYKKMETLYLVYVSLPLFFSLLGDGEGGPWSNEVYR